MIKRVLSLVVMLALTATVAMAGTPMLSGDYVEVRSNHVLAGGCTYSAEASTDAHEAVLAWRITSGDLAGLSVVAAVLGEGNLQLGDYARETVLFIDAKATPAQQHMLVEAFTARYEQVFGTVKTVEMAEIAFRSTDDATYEVVVPNQVAVATRKMVESDHEASCEPLVWYGPFTGNDAQVNLVQTAQNAYSGDALASTWVVPNKRSAYIGTFSFAEGLAAR